MGVYHIVLFKLKPGVEDEKVQELTKALHGLVGKIPGLSKMSVGPPLESTAHRGQGYNLAVVAILDKPETVKIYAEHPEHLKVHAFRQEVSEETLAYDLVY